eukprot:m.193199 g.193199  ORF g.193199 m.193199 type:complete len:159 (+) comp10603_c2_seq15:1157-1633(+)
MGLASSFARPARRWQHCWWSAPTLQYDSQKWGAEVLTLCSCATILLTLFLFPFQHLHLGTNAVQLPDGRFAAVLHALPLGGPKRYLNFAYLFSGKIPFTISHIASRPFDLPLNSVGHGFVFTSSLTLVGSHLVLAYNVNDRTSNFVSLSLNEFLSYFD